MKHFNFLSYLKKTTTRYFSLVSLKFHDTQSGQQSLYYLLYVLTFTSEKLDQKLSSI